MAILDGRNEVGIQWHYLKRNDRNINVIEVG
jgi:hypothetical protein